MTPSLRQLRYLCAVADHRHFGRAALACHVSQSTLSAGIAELESRLDARLLERSAKQVLVTPIGERIVVQARRVLGEAEHLVSLARAHSEPLSGDIRLGVIPTVGPFLLPRVLGTLRERFPQLRLYLQEELSSRLANRLGQADLDVVILAFPYPLGNAEVAKLFTDEFQLCLPPDHPLARHRQVRHQQLEGEALLLLEEGHCLREHALEACELDTRKPNLAYQCTSLHTLVQMVANGLGLTLLPQLAIDAGILGDTTLPLRRFRGGKTSRAIGLAWRASDPRREDYLLLAEFIRGQMGGGRSP